MIKAEKEVQKDQNLMKIVQTRKYSTYRDDCRLDNLRPEKIRKLANTVSLIKQPLSDQSQEKNGREIS